MPHPWHTSKRQSPKRLLRPACAAYGHGFKDEKPGGFPRFHLDSRDLDLILRALSLPLARYSALFRDTPRLFHGGQPAISYLAMRAPARRPFRAQLWSGFQRVRPGRLSPLRLRKGAFSVGRMLRLLVSVDAFKRVSGTTGELSSSSGQGRRFGGARGSDGRRARCRARYRVRAK